MNLLGTLLSKDLKRARRNPAPWLLSLLIPFLITGMIGMIFGGSRGGGLGTVRIAVVDEGDSVLSRIIRDGFNRPSGDQPLRFEAELLERDEAIARVTNNELSAAIIVPAGFLDDFLNGDKPVALELIKNPAQGIHPAIVEEMASTLVTLLNAARRILGDDLPRWRAAFDDADDFDLLTVAGLLVDAGNELAVVRDYMFPPLITFETATRADNSPASSSGVSTFAYVLIGVGAMFLLMLADQGMRDLYREMRFRTLLRFRAVHEGLAGFIASKVVFTAVTAGLGAVILFVGGGIIFRIDWPHPLAFAGLTLAFTVFGAGLMSLISALAGAERLADTLNPVVAMVLSLVGGCMFPPDSFPLFLREHITPLMPTAWFADAARSLLWSDPNGATLLAAVKLAGLGLICIGMAAALFHRRIARGEAAAA